MQTLKSIVAGIDFTPESTAALRTAIRLAQWNRAAIHAVHVIDILVAMEIHESLSSYQKDIYESLIADARGAWEKWAREIEDVGQVTLDVRIQNRIAGILASARERGADLLVLGANGGGKPDIGFGTVATACVRHAMCKVLLVRDTQLGAFKTIVACVDFSPNSRLALEQAASIATQEGAALHILHVFDAPWHKLHYRSPTPEADPHFQQQYRRAMQQRLAAFVGELGLENSHLNPTQTLMDHQGHRSGIVVYAQSIGADLIVLGTRGRTNLRDLLLGSTAEKALRDSTCSVLAVKPEGFTHPLATGEGQPRAHLRASF